MAEPAERAAIYARVSTDEQVDGTSLGTQLSRSRAYAAAHGWEIAGEYVDEGVSGARATRPALDRMMAEARRGRFGVVVVAKLDRFGRSVRHLSALLGELDDLGVQFVSVAENIDGSTSVGRLQRTLLSSFAEFERDRIRERMMDGIMAVAREGYWPGGPPPFGYRTVRDGRHSRLEVNPAEEAVILHAVECVVDKRMSAHETADELNALSLLPRRSPRWTQQSLRYQLGSADGLSGRWTYKRPTRTGKPARDSEPRYQDPVVIQIPAILTPERHEALKQALEATSTGPGATQKKNTYLLSRRITSPCGHPMYGHTNGFRKATYKCAQSWAWVPLNERCRCPTVPGAVIERDVWSEIAGILTNPELLMRGAREALQLVASTKEIETEDLAAIDRRIARLERGAGEQVAKLLAAGMDPAVAQHAVAALTSDLESLRAQRAKVAAWSVANAERTNRAERLWELARRAARILAEPTPEVQRRVIEALDVRVKVSGYRECASCQGSGWQAAEPNEAGKRPKGWKGIVPCAACQRSKRTMEWSMTGEVPDTLLDVPGDPAVHDPGVPGLPFRVLPGSASA